LAVCVPGAAAVSGGRLVDESAFPWFARVGDDECAAVLVAADRLVTSADCAEDRDLFFGRARVGAQRRRITGVSFPAPVVAAEVAGRRVNCDSAGEAVGCVPDLALLRLSRPVMAPVLALAGAVIGEPAVLVGHGTTAIDDDQTAPARVRAADLRVIDDQQCRRRYRSIDRAYLPAVNATATVCADDPTPPTNAGVCVGDGGAPLLADRAGTTVLLAIGSLAAGCGEEAEPSVFTDTWQFREFVLNPTPTWRPHSAGYARITGRGRVGQQLTCHAPRFTGKVDRIIYSFRNGLEDRNLQRGPKRTYKVRRADRGDDVTCWALAVNAGGVFRTIPVDGQTIPIR
jgi:hypothetical protein